jgi:hypothetical protein
MAKDNWTNSSGGDFAIGTNWSTGSVPVSSTIANISATGTYSVKSSVNETVLALTMGAVVEIEHGTSCR